MKVQLIVPVKALASGKSRLAPVLSTSERADLVATLLSHVLEAAATCPGISRMTVVSADPEIRDMAAALGADSIADPPGADLNGALEHAVALADSAGVLILPADLPLVAPEDIAAVLPDGPGIVIAPDRGDSGTNALALSPPDCIPFRFGIDSFSAHCEAADRAGLTVRIVRRPGLAFDLDTPADYREWVNRAR